MHLWSQLEYVWLVILTLAYWRMGTARFVKIGVFILMVSFISRQVISRGPDGLWPVLFVVGITVVSTFIGLKGWAQPRQSVRTPASASDCPDHAKAKIETWTHEFLQLGFRVSGEYWGEWEFKGEKRRNWIRYFTHATEPIWAEIEAVGKSKTVARKIASEMMTGGMACTCDMMMNQEIFPQPDISIQRLARAASTQEMFQKHSALLACLATRTKPVSDPREMDSRLYDAWIERLIYQRQFVVKGQQVVLATTAIPVTMFRTYMSWFH